GRPGGPFDCYPDAAARRHVHSGTDCRLSWAAVALSSNRPGPAVAPAAVDDRLGEPPSRICRGAGADRRLPPGGSSGNGLVRAPRSGGDTIAALLVMADRHLRSDARQSVGMGDIWRVVASRRGY